MTGQKDRYSTTEKLWKLDDEQLTTPRHDELVLMWFDSIFAFTKLLDFLPGLPQGYTWEITRINPEHPIMSGSYIIGYWDIILEVKTKYCDVLNSDNTVRYDEFLRFCPRYFCIECKPSILSFGQTIRQLNTYISYIDSDRQAIWNDNIRNHKVIILFTPDIRFKNAFESQGINVISP
jgi:hypothetical protein